MAERPMGLETEYGFSALRDKRGNEGRCADSSSLVALARKNYRYLNGRNDAGVFLENGARFYIDCGAHPELCTPEVMSPFEVVRYAEAGDEILTKLVALLPSSSGALVFKCNVDYVSNQTWAAHENYGHKCDPDVLPEELIPHLASRLIYTGAGGFNSKSRGIEFCISPRVFHLDSDTTSSSTSARGIYHVKNESLSNGGWNRMHVLCGESLCSHLASSLKFGTTALIVALVERGKHPGAGVRMERPLNGMIDFCQDISLKAEARMEDGRSMTALDIQWHYLRFAEANLDDPCMPAWAGRICEVWRDILERLTRDGVAGVRTRLDWAIKHALYTQHTDQRGISPEEVDSFNALRVVRRFLKRGPIIGEDAESTGGPGRGLLSDPSSKVRDPQESSKLTDDQRAKLSRLRCELFELDVRYSQLGGSVFSSMDKSGLLDHCVPEVTPKSVRNAVRQPPKQGRAGIRGKLIKSLRPHSKYRCDWYGIWSSDGTWLDLSDPQQQEVPEWVKPVPRRPLSDRDNCGVMFLHAAEGHYDRGNYEAALDFLQRFRGRGLSPAVFGYSQLLARVQSRRGFLSAALEAFGPGVDSRRPRSYSTLLELMILHRYEGIVPGTGFLQLLGEARQAFEQIEAPDDHERFTSQGMEGMGHLLGGELSRAESLMREAISRPERSLTYPKLCTRIRADLADVYRRLGKADDARRELGEAESVYQNLGFSSEFSDNVLLRRAKLESQRADVLEILDQAEGIQTRVGNRLGLVKTHLLRARILTTPAVAERSHNMLTSLPAQVPVLQTCPLFKKILDRWDDWISGQQLLGETDEFWGM